MQIKATITRTQSGPTRFVRLTFAAGARPYIRESIIARNIGPRPWSEMSFTNDDGCQVRVYGKNREARS